MGSSRLLGKSMLPLAGRPLVERMLQRLKRCKKINELVLAIPDNRSNQILEEVAKDIDVKVFKGSEDNLVERYWMASKESKADVVVRIPADNPTPEPNEIDKIIQFHIENNRNGFSSNLAEIDGSGYPDGIGAEVFDFESLEKLIKKNLTLDEKEHVHLNFYNYQKKLSKDEKNCPVKTINCPEEFARPELVLDVNTYDQYLFMKSLYDNLYPVKPNFHILDILNWYDNYYLK